MESEELKLAQIAYHAYGQTTDFKNYQGLPMPKWEELPERIQTAWIASAVAVRTELERIIGRAYLNNESLRNALLKELNGQ